MTIPNSVTSIGFYAFWGCSGLTSVTIPNNVVYIGAYAFSRCSGLTSVTIPNSVTSIGREAFSRCSGLTEIKVANGNSVYDSRNNCNAIIKTSTNTLIVGCKNTIIPNSVTSIGSYVFNNCSGLTKVKVTRKEPPTITSSIFSNVSHVYVPYGSKAKYEAAQYWKNFNIRMLSDCNGDDAVTMADANAIVNYFLATDKPEDFDTTAADVNEDGSVTMADANQIVNMFLSGEK